MALTPTALLDCVLIINGNTISDHGNKVELPITVEALDTTTFGQTYHTRTGGLKDASLNVTLLNDFSAANLDSIMFPLIGTVVSFIVRPTSAATSATNPAYTGSVFIAQWSPLVGSIGQLDSLDMSFPTSGTISRLTS